MSKRPSSIFNDPGHLYNQSLLLKLFTFSSLALMVGILWWIWQDFDRPWKDDQRHEMKWEAGKLALEQSVLNLRSRVQRADLDRRLEAANSQIASREKEIAEKDAELGKAKGAFYAADMDFKEQKQYTTEAEYWVHEARTEAERDEWRKKLKEEKDKEDRLRDARQYADQRLREITVERKKLQEELDEVILDERKNPDLKRLEIVAANIEKKKSYNPAREIPLLDFLAPPTKVEQIVLDNLVENYEFSTPKKVDRCGTCHILTMKVGYEQAKYPVEILAGGKTNLAKLDDATYRFVYSIVDQVAEDKVDLGHKYWYQRELLRRVRIHHKTLDLLYKEYDPESGEIGLDNGGKKVWRLFKKGDDGKLVESPDGKPLRDWFKGLLERMKGGAHWRTHPHFDDMVGGSSPHPYETFGCTSCHQGRGWSVDFGLASHTPNREKIEDWMTDAWATAKHAHLPLSAGQTLDQAMAQGSPPGVSVTTGWVTDEATAHRWEAEFDWSESKLHYWSWPQRPKMLVQASCLQCHKEGLYAAPKPEYEHVHLGPPDPDAPEMFDWEDHSAAMNPGLRTEPNRVLVEGPEKKAYRPAELERGLDNFLRFGCYGCHKLDPNVYPFMQSVDAHRPKVGPQLDGIAAKTNKPWARKWVRNPKDFRAGTRMPRFFGLSNNSHNFRYRFAEGFDEVDADAWANAEIYSMVEWLFAESEGRAPKYEKIDLSKGDPKAGERILVADGTTTGNMAKACIACHDVEIRTPALQYDRAALKQATDPASGNSTGWGARMSRRQGPDLTGIGSKVTPEWLYHWLLDPRSYWHQTNMPNLRLTDQQALDVTAYLIGLKNETFAKLPDVPHEQPVIDRIAQELRVGEQKESTQEALNAVKRMTDRERTLYVGSKLFKHYGCFGCHTVEAYKNATPIGTEVTEWGSKLIDRLEFNHVPIEHTRFDFAYAKLINPRIYDFGMPRRNRPFERLKMPRFGFSPQEAKDLATFLVALVADPVPAASMFNPDERQAEIIRGRQIVRQYNCQGCHVIENAGGDIWPAISNDKWKPPDLKGQGMKTNPAWLFDFMNNPVFFAIPGVKNSDHIRPWHSINMPTFGLNDEELRAVVRYFASLSNAPQDFEIEPKDSLVGPAAQFKDPLSLKLSDPKDRARKYTVRVRNRLEEARALFQEYQCKSCHSEGAPIANAAPNFRLAREGRLRDQWIVDWLWAPLKLQPGTAMPMFFANDEGPMTQDPQFFKGVPADQIGALRDFIRHHYTKEDR